jgi:hypothetical protein
VACSWPRRYWQARPADRARSPGIKAGRRPAGHVVRETGIVGTKLPDEVVALPSALLQAGFGGVAASLWSVADIRTAMLMKRFYRCWRKDRLSLLGHWVLPTVAARHHQSREGRVFQTLQRGAVRHAHARRGGRRFSYTGHEPGSGESRLCSPLLVGCLLSDRRLENRLRVKAGESGKGQWWGTKLGRPHRATVSPLPSSVSLRVRSVG